MNDVREITRRIPGWRDTDEIDIQRVPGGYTNENYYITRNGERFVLRVSGTNTIDLGIKRNQEATIYRTVSNAHIAPELVAYLEPEGHLVTRFVDGEPWDFEDFKIPDVQRTVVEMLKRAHVLEGISHRFDPFDDIYSRIKVCRSHHVTLPDNLDIYCERLKAVKARLDEGIDKRIGLCHNDPFPNNFLHNGKAWLLDWEFGGMGDIMWDVACITMGSDTHGKEAFLKLYFGDATPRHSILLEDARYVVQFWNAMWALLQSFLSPIDHDFAGWAERIFSSMEAP